MRNIGKRLARLQEAAINSCVTSKAKSYIEAVEFHHAGYAEPGRDDPESGVIATGDYNNISEWNEESRTFVTLDETPGRFAEILEKLKVEMEWSDEWTDCERCRKLVRNSPDCYGWTPAYCRFEDGELVCHECIEADPSDYLDYLRGNHRHLMTIPIDLTQHGYVKLQGEFQHGMHHGMDADPLKIAKRLRANGVSNFIFTEEDTSQFYMQFGVWAPAEEAKQFKEMTDEEVNGPSVSDALERNLRASSLEMEKLEGPGVRIAHITPEGVNCKIISMQDFADGKALR
jgi:hypothetical protein